MNSELKTETDTIWDRTVQKFQDGMDDGIRSAAKTLRTQVSMPVNGLGPIIQEVSLKSVVNNDPDLINIDLINEKERY